MTLDGDGDEKVWMTEFGAPTSDPRAQGVSQEEQSTHSLDVLAGVAAAGWSGPAFISASGTSTPPTETTAKIASARC